MQLGGQVIELCETRRSATWCCRAFAQGHQHPPQVVDRGAAGDLDSLERCRGFIGLRCENPTGGGGLDAHNRHLTGDRIMQLARKSQPLLEQRSLTSLVAQPATAVHPDRRDRERERE